MALNEQSVLRLGSISKQFTAAAIMMLQEQGKLAVTDDIHKYVASFPTEGNLVTIENLLTHTSGIANYTDDDDLFDKEIQVPTSVDDTLARFAKHPMVFKPGEAMAYSNTGYSLLGKIIEVAIGQSYKDFIEQHIFKKLKMNQSSYEGQELVTHRASGYEQTEQGFINTSYINMDWPYAAGALISTPTDLNIWFNALSSGKLISKQVMRRWSALLNLTTAAFHPMVTD
ncbi:serine hydrolase domain-containing protein [Pseudoalteromonas sp. MelDa3]|uniref:serine hydrolase domain-containing protein n=1 Tax=Pseudoalteromonas sp. MelDa3 TaxID=888435 RepID=UPI0027E58B93|nr:serine hydrolase domain-containing protein [Pseudoalteromonas sp. MelDa3]